MFNSDFPSTLKQKDNHKEKNDFTVIVLNGKKKHKQIKQVNAFSESN